MESCFSSKCPKFGSSEIGKSADSEVLNRVFRVASGSRNFVNKILCKGKNLFIDTFVVAGCFRALVGERARCKGRREELAPLWERAFSEVRSLESGERCCVSEAYRCFLQT